MAGRQQYQATTLEDWQRSDQYHNSFLIPQDDILDAVVRHCKAHGLPDIAVSTAQGKFLNLLAKSLGVKRVLEIGTLGGWISSSSCISISTEVSFLFQM
jgi:predicted O-methyltransferase YrrM